MKNVSLILLAIVFSGIAFAQKQQFNINDATLGLSNHLAPENIKQLKWIPNENAYMQLVDNRYNQSLVKVQLPNFQIDTLINLNELNQQLFQKDSIKQFPEFNWINESTGYLKINENIYLARLDNGKMKLQNWLELPEKIDNLHFEKEKKQFAFTQKNNLFWIDSLGKTKQITADDEGSHIVNGQAVHQYEFGIDRGIFFSPKGNALAFYRMDESMVNDYPIIDWAKDPAEVNMKKYPMAGTNSHHVTIGVFNVHSKEIVYLQTGAPKEQYLTGVTWSPNEQYIYISILNRDQNHLKVNQYNAKDGAFLKTLFEEKDERYIQPLHGLYFLPNTKNEFVFWSQRDGFNHLYRYDQEGKLLNQITSGNWLVNEIKGHNSKSKELIVTTNKESPKSKNTYAVNWTNGKMRKLDIGDGFHDILVNNAGSYFIDRFQNEETPRNINVMGIQSKLSKNILTSKDPLENYDRAEVRNINLQAEDGTDLYGKLILPPDLNPEKKYPVIVYLYNGPNVQLIKNTFPKSGNLWYEYMAQKGYVIFTMDGRGSSNRGLDFEQAVFRNLGQVEMEDQLVGVDYLKQLPFVDTQKLGVYGWSYGGFMTTSFMLHYPEVFKVGVAGGPVIDWSMYEIMYTERYMDSPQQNPEGFHRTSLLNKAKNLKGKLLMIHGSDDPIVVWQHSMKFLQSCVQEGVQLDYFVYPGHEHNVRGKDRVHLLQKITDYFDLHLK